MATHEVESNLATQGQNCAVINPYALADLVSGQRIPWDKISDPHSALEQVLATPYEELFDPKYGGPLYIGHMLDKNLALVRARSPLLDYKSPTEANDAETSGLRDISQFATLADLAKVADLKSILDWPIFLRGYFALFAPADFPAPARDAAHPATWPGLVARGDSRHHLRPQACIQCRLWLDPARCALGVGR